MGVDDELCLADASPRRRPTRHSWMFLGRRPSPAWTVSGVAAYSGGVRVRVALVGVGLTVGLALVACGGSARLSRSAYRAELSSISRRLDAAFTAGWPRYKGLLVANPPQGVFAAGNRAEVVAELKSAAVLERLSPPRDAA